MMSGLQLTVRQIGNYPAQRTAGALDLVLLQQGGLGGPYFTTTPLGLLAPLATASLNVGVALPEPAGRGNLLAQAHVMPREGEVLWNAYRGAAGYRTWLSGLAARLAFQPTRDGFSFGVVPSQAAGQPIAAFANLLELDTSGALKLPRGTLRVARDPGHASEVATMGWVNRSSVRQFNGRSGNVHLAADDIYQALDYTSPLATEGSVNQALGAFLHRQPFVFTWNGRTGNVWLSDLDVSEAYCRPGASPIAPTPPAGDFSKRIATTDWVGDFILNTILPDIGRRYAPLDSPGFIGKPAVPWPPLDSNDSQIASTGWVRTVLQSIGAGVLSWNGRSGFVTLTLADITAAGGAPINNTALTGIPTAATAAPGTATTQLATTQFVTLATQDIIDNSVWSFNTRLGDVVLALQDILDADGQPITSLATSAPTALADGQFWFDPLTNVLNIWSGTDWLPAGGVVEISDTEPATNYNGKLWWDSAVGDLFIYYEGPSGGQWVVANASAGSPGVQGPPGSTGPQGIQGPPGPALNPQGTVTGAPGSLPATGNPGDFWVDTGTGEAWAWNGVTNTWVNLGVIGSAFPDAPSDGRLYGREALGGIAGQPMDWESIIDDGAY